MGQLNQNHNFNYEVNETNNCNAQLEEFSYYNTVQPTSVQPKETVNEEVDYLNEYHLDQNILDTIDQMIKKELALSGKTINVQGSQTKFPVASSPELRSSSVDSDLWEKQHNQEIQYPSITTVNSPTDGKYEIPSKNNVDLIGDTNVNSMHNYQYKTYTKRYVSNKSTSYDSNKRRCINKEVEDTVAKDYCFEFDLSNAIQTTKTQELSSHISKARKNESDPYIFKSNNSFNSAKVVKPIVKKKEAEIKTTVLPELLSNNNSLNEFTLPDAFKSEFDDLRDFEFTDCQFDNTDFCTMWGNEEKTPQSSFIYIVPENTGNSQIIEEVEDITEQYKEPEFDTGFHEKQNHDDSDTCVEEDSFQPITETSDCLDVNAQRIYEETTDNDEMEARTPPQVLPSQFESISDLPKLDIAKHKCASCFKVNKSSFGCANQIIETLSNLKLFEEYNSPNKYTLKFALENGNSNFRYVNSEVKTRYDPSIKRYSTKVLYSSKGRKLKRDYPSLCPYCKISDTKRFDSLFYERNNSCYRGHLINTHGINSTGEKAKLPKSGFVCYKLGKNSWSETVGFKCPYSDCDQCFLKGDKSHGFHEYFRHWNKCHISSD